MDSDGNREPSLRRGSSLIARPRRDLGSILPITAWLPKYQRARLGSDLIAGLALSALLIPESLGYAGIAGVSPELGLYAALGAVVAYALTGGTSILVVGPASAVAALSASIVSEFRGDVDHTQLIVGLTIASGVLLVIAGLFRLGWIVNFISQPVLHAFVAALSISIIVGQLDGLVGIEVQGMSTISKLVDVLVQVGTWHLPTVAIGVGAVIVLIALERFLPRLPAAIVLVVIGIALATAADLGSQGIALVGEIPHGLPTLGAPDLGGTRWLELLGGAMALVVVGFSEGYAAASNVAATTGERIDADQELLASGAANLGAGLLGGIAVSGSLSKSAASQAAGARTQITNLVAGVIVVATLLFLGPMFEHLPEPILAAIVFVAVLRSADPRHLLRLWNVNRHDFAAGAVTFTLVLAWETVPALAVGVAISLAFLVRRASFPDVIELEVAQAGDSEVIPDPLTADRTDDDSPAWDEVGVIRFEGPLIYANAERLPMACRELLDRSPGISRVVLDAEMMSDLDSTGADTLAALDDDLNEQGVRLLLARVHHRALLQIRRSHLSTRFDDRLHDHISEAVAAASS